MTIDDEESGDYFAIAERRLREDRERQEADKRIAQDALSVMQTEAGRRFVSWVLQVCRVGLSVSDLDQTMAAMLSGRRDAGLEIESVIRAASFDLYIRMLQEQHNG